MSRDEPIVALTVSVSANHMILSLFNASVILPTSGHSVEDGTDLELNAFLWQIYNKHGIENALNTKNTNLTISTSHSNNVLVVVSWVS
jgi:hypothetical protein